MCGPGTSVCQTGEFWHPVFLIHRYYVQFIFIIRVLIIRLDKRLSVTLSVNVVIHCPLNV